MRRRTYLALATGLLSGVTGCTERGPSGGIETTTTTSGSVFQVTDVSVLEYKPKDYEDRSKVAGSLEATIRYNGSDSIILESFRITGDVPRPHNEMRTGEFTNPSGDAIDSIEIGSGETQRIRMLHEPLYYVDLSSEGERTQEELDSSTCTGSSRKATLHFETKNRDIIEREITLEFGGNTVEFDEFAPDYGCTNVTVVSVDS
ncbi:hypothetical protein [Halomicrobium salinisoli]|uniref:hypothetical protein n=1 Tax=Halomicrobium salinisoli TaxID=2878391 RepID=UPI001CF0286E|nr:hypothetical protein [Halomicrobium salinisoli]